MLFASSNLLVSTAGGPIKAVDMNGFVPEEFGLLTGLELVLLPDMNLKGPMLEYMSSLSSLRLFSIPNSDISGSIPPNFVDEHPELTDLVLTDNILSGQLPSVDRLVSLTNLDVAENELTGTIPDSIGSGALEKLDLSFNRLTGELPTSLFQSSITEVFLGGNLIQGTISPAIGNMIDVERLGLGPSAMTGTLPPELFALPKLQDLMLFNSMFSGPLREIDFAQLNDTARLLWLNGNDFTGALPVEAIGSMGLLEELYVADNELTGTITETICLNRGIGAGDLQQLRVGCTIECRPGCCSDSCRD